MMLYSAYFLAISIKRPFPLREALFLAVAIGGACFSCYLLYVIKVILKEFCIVCFSFHSAFKRHAPTYRSSCLAAHRRDTS
jgi:uncharacterized membrane protein